MHTKPSFIEYGVLLIIEWVLFFALALFWAHWGGSIFHMASTLLALGGLLTAGVLTLKLKFNQHRMGVYYALCLIVVLMTWRLFSWPVFLSFVFTLYFLWRLMLLVEGRTVHHRWWLWITTICLTLILWLTLHSNSFHRALIAILIVQTLSVIGYEIIQVWRLSRRVGVFSSALIGFAAVTVIGFLVSLLFPYIKWILNLILYTILMGISYMVELLWLLFSKISRTKANENALAKMAVNLNRQGNQKVQKVPQPHEVNGDLLMVVTVVILLVIGYIVIRRWRFSDSKESRSGNQEISTSQVTMNPKQTYRLFEIFKAPKDPVRAAVFNMQKKLRKHELGRRKYETIGDWLERLPGRSNRETVQTVYEMVRYGKAEEVSDVNKSAFKKAMEDLEDDLKTEH